MDKKVFIHIGTHKTGTSAIQDFLLLNRKLLAQKGVLYPQKSRREYYDAVDGGFTVSSKNIKHYKKLAALCKTQDKHVILSSETFSLFRNVSPMKMVLGAVNVKIICYLRRQDGLIQSMYNQAIKDGGRYSEISDFVPSAILDYGELLDHWAAVFGKENIIARPYERQQFKDNDLIADFLDSVGLELTGEFKRLNTNANPRLPIEALEYMRLLNSLLRDKKKSKRIKKRLIPYCLERFTDNTGALFFDHSLLSCEQRRSILDRYAASNQRVARDYLGRADGCLFYETIADDGGQMLARPRLSDELVCDITRYLCADRAVKTILIGTAKQDVSKADDFTRMAQAAISAALEQMHTHNPQKTHAAKNNLFLQ